MSSNIFVIGALKLASKLAPPPANPPNAPVSVTASINGLSVVGAFQDQATDEVDFLVQKTVDNGQNWTTLATPLALPGGGTLGAFSDTLTADQVARYRVCARNANGNSAFALSPQVTATPNAPTNLAQNGPVQPGAVLLVATDNSNVETGFRLERSANGTSGWAQVGANIAPRAGTGSLQISDTTVTPSSGPYYYRLQALHSGGGGNSAYTNVAGPFNTPAATGSAPVAQFVKYKDINYFIELDTSSSIDPDGAPLTSRQVNWGDGNVESHPTQTIFTHSYSGPGPWTIVLTVTKSDGQTHSRTSQVRPRLDRAPDFVDDFSTGARAPSQNGIFYRNSPNNTTVVSGKAALAPSTFSIEKHFPATAHGKDNQTASEQRMGSTEELNEIHFERYLWFPDGTEGWANNGPNAALQPTLPRLYCRLQNSKNIVNCSISAGSNVVTTSTPGQLRNADHGPVTVLGTPGQQFVVSTAFRLPGTFDSDGAGNLVGTGTSWLTHLAVGDIVIIGGKNYAIRSVTDNTHCFAGGVAQALMGTNKVPPAGVGQTMAYAANIMNVNEAVSPVQVTMDRTAFNTVGPVTGVVGGYPGENNKFLIMWDTNGNYSGDVQIDPEFQVKTTTPGDARLAVKVSGQGARTAPTNKLSVKDYGTLVSTDFLVDANRGRWVRYRESVKMSRNMGVGGQIKIWLDDNLVVNLTTANNKPICAHPRGNNFFQSWYDGGWANTGFSQDSSWFLAGVKIWTIAPDWFPGWSS